MGRHRAKTQDGPIARLTKAAIDAAEGICALVSNDDRFRDAFPLPLAEERERWLGFWDNDFKAWEVVLARVLGRIPLNAQIASEDRLICWSFDQIDQFFDVDVEQLNPFLRSLEVRFVMRVFLPYVATQFERPSKALDRIVSNDNIYLLEVACGFDPTIIHNSRLTNVLYPKCSELRRQRWELLQRSLAVPPQPIDPRQVKYAIAGFLRWISKGRDDRPTIPMLFAMFNSLAKSNGVAIGNRDADFTDDEQTFRKGSQRFAIQLPSLS